MHLTEEDMDSLSKEQKQEILDIFGESLIENVRDGALRYSMDIVKLLTINPIKLKQYGVFSSLSDEQQEAICDLLSETITHTLYRFLEMFEDHSGKMKLIIINDQIEYNMTAISEKMGSEIACFEDDGWIQKFSEIGRFVL